MDFVEFQKLQIVPRKEKKHQIDQMANTMFPTVAKAAGSKRTPPTQPKAIKYVLVLAVNGLRGIMRAFDQPVVWRSESGRGIPDQSCNCCHTAKCRAANNSRLEHRHVSTAGHVSPR